MIRILVVIALVLCARTAYAGDEPDTADAKAYFSDGTAAFQRADYAAASRAFAAGYEVEKWSGFLFAWAQSERFAGNCTKAVELYSKFIWTKPADEFRDHALGWIKQCNGSYIEPPPETPVKKDPPIERPKPPPPPPPHPTTFHHKLAITFAAGAVASTVVGIRFYTWAQHDFDAADRAFEYADVAHARDRGDRRLLYAQLSGGLALGLTAATVVRFALHRRAKLEVVATPTGAGISGRF